MISVGIDVSKSKSTVCIMKPGGEVLKGLKNKLCKREYPQQNRQY